MPRFSSFDLIGLSDDELRLIISQASKILGRRGARPAVVDEIERSWRIKSIEDFATEVLRGRDDAFAFLEQPHPMLEMQTPRSVVEGGDEGYERVNDILCELILKSEPPGDAITEIEALAEEVWGSRERGLEFLRRPHLMLHMRTPREVAGSGAEGARRAREIILGVKYGTGV